VPQKEGYGEIISRLADMIIRNYSQSKTDEAMFLMIILNLMVYEAYLLEDRSLLQLVISSKDIYSLALEEKFIRIKSVILSQKYVDEIEEWSKDKVFY
jgi:hypothetical protein